MASAANKLAQLDLSSNLEGLDDIGARYGVDVTQPTINLFEASEAFVVALKHLQLAIKEKMTSNSRNIMNADQAAADMNALHGVFDEGEEYE